MPTNPDHYNTAASVDMSDLLDRALQEMGPSTTNTVRAKATASHAPDVESHAPDVESHAPIAEPPAPVAESHAPVAGNEASPPPPPPPPTPASTSASNVEIPPVLLHAYNEISSMLGTLRCSRDALEQATTERLHNTSAKLVEVTSATEVATTGLLDGLDRAINMVDELDELDGSGDERAAGTRTRLRDELFQSINFLQFQDITTQQLNYASSVLQDMEQRLAEIASSFDPSSVEVPELMAVHAGLSGQSAAVSFDPDASLCDAERRQALVDEILTRMD